MASTSDIKNGLCIEHSNDIFSIVEFQHVKPGKGAAFVRTKLKSLTNGKVLSHTFPAGHKIQVVRVERRKFQFLYSDGQGFNFMDNETYEQLTFDEKLIENPGFLKEGDNVDVLFDSKNDIPLTLEMAQYVVLKVEYTEPGVKGDTATNTLKPAKLETGATVNVPLFINEGDLIKVESATGRYVERAKA